MIDKNIKELNKKFNEIKKLGYVKATRNGTTGIGKTFEELIGKKEDSLCEPDFMGIEIKTKLFYSKSYTNLFNCAPKGNGDYEIKRLKENYGYPDRILKSEKVLMASVSGDKANFVGNRYFFKLLINEEEKKLYLEIRDINFSLLDCSTYWNFSELQEKLERKLSYLALITAFPTTRNKEKYYKYIDIKFYKLKNFNKFIELIKNGKIIVTFKIGIYREGEKRKEINDHGTSFQIQEKDLSELFDKINLE